MYMVATAPSPTGPYGKIVTTSKLSDRRLRMQLSTEECMFAVQADRPAAGEVHRPIDELDVRHILESMRCVTGDPMQWPVDPLA
jgi:hypothetical protein